MISRNKQLLLAISSFLIISGNFVYAQEPELNKSIQQSNSVSQTESEQAEQKREVVQKVEAEQKVQSDSPNQQVDQNEVVKKVQSFYADAQDFQADFKQVYTYKIYGRKKLSTGKVFFKKPARMRWDYEVPTPRVFIADGQTLWVYEPEEAQVFKRKLSSAQLPVALRFMQGKARLDQEFKIDSVQALEDNQVELSLKPKSTQVDFKALRLKVNRSSGEVLASTLVDSTGNLNEISFAAAKVNQGLPNDGFSFTPPTGVRVIDENDTP